MSEKATVLVSEVKKVKSGESSRGPWAFWLVVDGNEESYGVLSPKDKEQLEKAKELEGKRAEIEFETTDKGRRLISVKEAVEADDTRMPEIEHGVKLGTGDYVRAKTSPSDARDINGRKAGELAKELIGIFVPLLPPQEWTPALICAFYDSLEGHIFAQLLRRGRLMEDSDIPFMPEYEEPQ